MDTLTKQSQGMTKPLGMTGPIQGIKNLPINFGGEKPMDVMSMRLPTNSVGEGPVDAMSMMAMGRGSYIPPGMNFNPMSSAQDASTYAVGKAAADISVADKEKAKIAEVARRKLLNEKLDDQSKKSQGLLYQGLDFSPIKLRGGKRG